MRFRKKPVEIEAMQFVVGEIDAVLEWVAGHGGKIGTYRDLFDDPYLEIETLEGVMEASLGDWIIRGVKGEFYPCKPDIFAATYEHVA